MSFNFEDFKDLKDDVEKLNTDVYKGSGPRDPSITSRLLVLEGNVTEITKELRTGRWLLISTLIGVVLNLIIHSK